MSCLQVRKAILRSRAVEFTRLLMLSMLENATDTFSAMLTVLESELGKLSVDQFLNEFSEIIEELRLKTSNREDGDNNSVTNSKDLNSTFNPQKSSNSNIIVLDDDFGTRNVNGLQETNRLQRSNEIRSEINPKQNNGSSSLVYKKETMAGNQCNVCKNTVPSDQKFYFSLGICQNCYSKGWENRPNSDHNEIEHLPNESSNLRDIPNQIVMKGCKRCRRPIPESSLKGLFKGNCSSCYYKIKRLNQLKQSNDPVGAQSLPAVSKPATFNPQIGDRQCSECKKIVSKGKVFYRSAHLCKNCYERQRVLVRKTSKKQCSVCKILTDGEILSGKCIPCYYQQVHMSESPSANNEVRQFDEHQNDDSLNSTDKINSWINSIEDNEQNSAINEDVEMLLHLCQPEISRCSSCKKSVEQEELGKNGICGSCQHTLPNSSISIKDEDTN